MTKCFKIRYRDEIAAKLALASIRHQDGSGRSKTEQRAYRCPQCRGWHLTAKPFKPRPKLA
jgi:hypothetical protein